MKSIILSSAVVVSCTVMASAAPATITESDQNLVARGGGGSKVGPVGQKVAQAAENWALNPQGAMDRDQRKKNREAVVNYVTGSGSTIPHRHPELQKAMNANSAAGKKSSSKRDVEDLDIRDYGEELTTRGAGASKIGGSGQKIAKAVESWALNPQSATDRDQRKKHRESYIDYITGGGSGSGSATRHRYPEMQKVMNANGAANVFASKQYGKSSSSKRDVEDLDIRGYSEELAARGTGASKSKGSGQKIAKAVESWALNPQSATDRDQRKKNRESAIDYVTGGGSGSATRHRHPEMQKVMNANSAANAFASKKYGKSSESSKRDFDDLQVRDYNDLILEARDFYDLD